MSEKVLKQILQKLDRIDTEIKELKTDVKATDNRLINVEDRLTNVEDRLTNVEDRLTNIEKNTETVPAIQQAVFEVADHIKRIDKRLDYQLSRIAKQEEELHMWKRG